MKRSELLEHFGDFEIAMKLVKWKKKHIAARKPPKDFEGW